MESYVKIPVEQYNQLRDSDESLKNILNGDHDEFFEAHEYAKSEIIRLREIKTVKPESKRFTHLIAFFIGVSTAVIISWGM